MIRDMSLTLAPKILLRSVKAVACRDDARVEKKAGKQHPPPVHIFDSLRTCQEKKHPEGIVVQSTSRKDADIGEGGSARPKPCGVAKHALGEGKNDAA